MKKLPKARLIRISAGQKRALARWLNEWRLDKLLSEEEHGQSASRGKPLTTAAKSLGLLYEAKPAEVGQIRLFHPFSDATAARPRYVAVLKDHGDGTWLVAPFSKFSEPAVPGEWSTGREVPALRNLCIWNARSMPDPVLARSWVVDRMTTSKVEEAGTIHRLLAEGKALPLSLSRRVGPPLAHPLDPRLDYIEEEREWFSASSANRPSGKRMESLYSASEDIERSLPLAAEERAKYGSQKRRTKKRRGLDRDS